MLHVVYAFFLRKCIVHKAELAQQAVSARDSRAYMQ